LINIENIANKSIILNFLYRLAILIRKNYETSVTSYVLGKLWAKIKLYCSHSKICTYLSKSNYLDRLWASSLICNYLTGFINMPGNYLRKVYLKNEVIFSHSYIFKFVKYLLAKFEFIIGFALTIIMIIPDHRWYNAYGVLITILLALLFFMKTIVEPSTTIDTRNLDFTFILFFASIIMAATTSLFPKDSLNYLIQYMTAFIAVIIIVSSMKNVDNLNTVIEFAVVAVFLTSLYGIWQWKVVGIEVNPSLTDVTLNQGMTGRVYSTMGNPNVYGELLVLIMPFFGTVIFNAKNLMKKIIYAFLSIPVLVILLKTGSRSAWVAFAFAVFVFVFFKNKKLLPLLIIAGILAVPFLPSSIYKRILTLFNPNDTSLKYRKQILEPAMPMLRDYWFGGVGLGNKVFNIIYKRYKPFTLKTVAHTHNLYIQIWLEAGIAAIISIVWFIFRILRKSVISIMNKKDTNINNILIAAISGLSGILIMGFADHIWFYNRILFLFWVVIAIIISSIKLLNMENS